MSDEMRVDREALGRAIRQAVPRVSGFYGELTHDDGLRAADAGLALLPAPHPQGDTLRQALALLTEVGTGPLVITVHGTPAWSNRFWSKVDQTGDCWVWTAGCDRDGYGIFWLAGRTVRAARVAWLLGNPGCEIPPGHVVRHRCDNPPCVRSEHLLIGTSFENDMDRVERQRSATGDRNGARLYPERLARGAANYRYRPDECRNGHPLNRRYVSPSGERICTDCVTERRRRYRAKARAEGRRAW